MLLWGHQDYMMLEIYQDQLLVLVVHSVAGVGDTVGGWYCGGDGGGSKGCC